MNLHMNMKTGAVYRRTAEQDLNQLRNAYRVRPGYFASTVRIDSREDAISVVERGGLFSQN